MTQNLFILADLHAIIKQNDHSAIEDSVKNVALPGYQQDLILIIQIFTGNQIFLK